MIALTICSTKGGVGKTTLTANLAGFLVDADIQPTLSSYFPLLQQADGGLHQLITTGQIQGAIGPLQDAGVLAADLLLSPIPPEVLSAREFARGTLGMLDRLRPMGHLGAPVGHLHGLIYRMDRTIDATEVANTLRRATFGESRGGISILSTVVPATVAYREAATARQPVHRIEKLRRGPTASALEVMTALVRELLPHIEVGATDTDTPVRESLRHA